MQKRKTVLNSKKLERNFQRQLIKDIKKRFKGCFVLKLDPNYLQGVPDLLILFKNHWATLEVKRSAHAPHRPNQDTYVKIMNKMSFSRFVYPENKESVLNEMERVFKR